MQRTGANPVRPHMLLFNATHTHAILSFVVSGHVVIFDAETRTPLNCFETTVGSTGTRQAHAAYPAPDGSFVLVYSPRGESFTVDKGVIKAARVRQSSIKRLSS